MKVDWKEEIGGYKAIVIRDLLRHLRDRPFDHAAVGFILGKKGRKPTGKKLADFVGVLVSRKLIERVPAKKEDKRPYYQVSSLGMSMANAKSTAPLTLDRARTELAAFLDRVRAANADTTMAYRVKRVTLFGSVANGQHAHVSDVDLLVTYEAKSKGDDFNKACTWLWYEHNAKVRSSDVGVAVFAHRLLEMALKDGKSFISIHGDSDSEIAKDGVVVFDADGLPVLAGPVAG